MAEENGRVWAPEVKDLGDKIVALTVAKAVELGDYMELVHKIKPAASAVAVAAPAAGPAPAAGLARPGVRELLDRAVLRRTAGAATVGLGGAAAVRRDRGAHRGLGRP